MERIKKLSQKLSDGTFSSAFPIGTDALFIDMLSGCNLEEELHLGSPSMTSFDMDEDNQMVITEEYKKEETQSENYYILITTFKVENEEMIIIQQLYFQSKEVRTLKRTKTITFISDGKNLKIKEVIS